MDTQASVLLLVEDNEDDVFLMRRALKAAKLNPRLEVATDGQKALDYLSGAGKFSDRAKFPLPIAVLLDLKLPYVHGFEVLKWIRQQPLLSGMIVAVLTSSPEERDQKRARDLGAKAYLVKPPTGEMLLQLFQPAPESVPMPTFPEKNIPPPQPA